MKIAIIHDSFTHFGGAEKVFLELLELYPNADVYISIINPKFAKDIKSQTNGKIYSSKLSKIPWVYKISSLLKPFIILYWENLNLSEYKLVISSSHSFNSKIVNTNKKTVHLSYVYTPPRYLLNNFNEMQFIKQKPFNLLLKPLLKWLNIKDIISAKKPDLLIACSKTTQQRILNRYHRKSILIYPPTSLSSNITQKKHPKYYLCFSRLVKQKGIDLAVKTCTQYNIPLLVVGTGPEQKNLQKIAGPTIKFTGFVSNKKLETIFSNTKALINCAIEEDFGMVTIEAASRGIPIIGYSSGGIKETVINKETGILFKERTIKSLFNAILKFESSSISPIKCHSFSQKFSKNVFREKIKALVSYYV